MTTNPSSSDPSTAATAVREPTAEPPALVGVLGGTGALGRGLVQRWAAAGLRVSIGSRDAAKAEAAAAAITPGPSGPQVTGLALRACAEAADIVVVAVPWEAHRSTLEQIREVVVGKVVVDAVNPLGFDKRGPYAVSVTEGSAAQQAQLTLPDAHVVAAFHHVSAVLLADPSVERVVMDIMVLGDDRASTDRVQELVEAIPGMRGIYAGRLRNCGQVEALTANLIAINRRYRAHAGLALTGL